MATPEETVTEQREEIIKVERRCPHCRATGHHPTDGIPQQKDPYVTIWCARKICQKAWYGRLTRAERKLPPLKDKAQASSK